jgi:hypothetical protein
VEGHIMNRGFSFTEKRPTIDISSRRQRLLAVKVIITYLERICDAERYGIDAVPQLVASPWRCEAELIASTIDEAIWILDTIQ